ncbi:hypothetical protein HMPREF0484_0989 [Klebsiella pneumoniae subsp. rhinoscleromatis ATCC 13884]|nr:hypothetical protein HMPREF0484_0989 [Klebsiella pneumoniae subsp. rhinoscleromatis ATCC 13884]
MNASPLLKAEHRDEQGTGVEPHRFPASLCPSQRRVKSGFSATQVEIFMPEDS